MVFSEEERINAELEKETDFPAVTGVNWSTSQDPYCWYLIICSPGFSFPLTFSLMLTTSLYQHTTGLQEHQEAPQAGPAQGGAAVGKGRG